MELHQIFMKRCIQIAKNGLSAAMPNPSVGAVIVVNGVIVSEGYTSEFGGNHAEVNAINAISEKEMLKKATLYVSLEPCSHFGKTPPCADLIVKHKIPKVVVGTLDPNKKVSGKGIEKLENAGIEVISNVLKDDCIAINKKFITFHSKNRPFVTLKWAQSADGFLAPLHREKQKPVWLSDEYSQQTSHKLRTEHQAILVGGNTVLHDNPSLTARDWQGKNPMRIVIDSRNNLSNNFSVFDNEAQTLIVSSFDLDKKFSAKSILKTLFKQNIQSVLIEGGAKTLNLFLNENLWDEAIVFQTNLFLNDGIHAPMIKKRPFLKENLWADEILKYRNND